MDPIPVRPVRETQSSSGLHRTGADALPPAASPSIGIGDIYYTLFRHKWKILICTVLGLGAAAAVFLTQPPPYRSQAKLFIRFVMEATDQGPVSEEMRIKSPDQRGETIINSEIQILTSQDLAREVAAIVGPERIVGTTASDPLNAAAGAVAGGLEVQAPAKSRILNVTFENKNAAIVQPVLSAVVNAYLKKHVEIHQKTGFAGDFLSRETDQLRSRLVQTEEELRRIRNRAGVLSIEDAKASLSQQIRRLRDDIFASEAELAERVTAFQEITRSGRPVEAAAAAPEAPAIPEAKITEYRSLLTRSQLLHRREQELLIQFTPESNWVVDVRRQIAETEQQRAALEREHPGLPTLGVAPATVGTASSGEFNAAAAQATIKALEAKIKVLRGQLDAVRAEAASIDQLEGSIRELRRKQELEEANYKAFSASLEKARIDEAFGTNRIDNINVIQSPTPPFMDRSQTNKLVLGIGAAGLLLGLAWAFAIELFIDRSIRRPGDVERAVGAKLFLSIPKVDRRMQKQLALSLGADAPKLLTAGEAKSSPDHARSAADGARAALTPFHETLRDRLIGYFESINLTHKPKLVAVTGLKTGVGVTTTAAGLARSLSETGEGSVLLVDMTAGQGAAQQFFKGSEVTNIDDVLQHRDNAQVQENLYVVTESRHSDQLSRNLPQRFNKLVPKLKASDFDYIIFDMPPVSQISVTPRLAGFMDMVLMVIESEKNDRDMVRRAMSLLAESKAQVGTVLNKTTTYVPARLHQDHLNDL